MTNALAYFGHQASKKKGKKFYEIDKRGGKMRNEVVRQMTGNQIFFSLAPISKEKMADIS
jgi:hypothetical protein